jgi:drug/metabolite transporter (DMT)-like permease
LSLGALLLVLLSAVTHAYWNFLLKRAGGGEVFVGLSKAAEAFVFLPFFLVFSWPGMPREGFTAFLVLVAAGGVLMNYAGLTMAYRRGDLTLVYPIQRGGTLLFLPVLAFLTLGERVDAVGAAGLVLILVGVVVLQLPELTRAAARNVWSHVRSAAAVWALFVALTNAVFTLWDKYALRTLSPFAYMYAYTVIVAACYATYIWHRHPRVELATTWRGQWWPIVQVGVFNTLSYLLALAALRTGVSSYVIGFRQLSIAVGIFFGWRLLGEPMTAPRRVGASLILAGCLMVSLAR